MAARRLRVLWITNMFHEDGAREFRGIFVTQQWNALLATGEVDLERVLVAQGRGVFDYLRANRRVRSAWDRGRFDLAHVHYGLTGLATLALPSPAPRVFTFYGSDINSPVQRAISYATARRARRRIFVARRLAEQWPDERNVVLPNGIDFDRVAPRPRDEACRELGLDPAARRVLFGGHPDNAVKGWPLFREVMDHVRRARPGVEELVLSEPGQPYDRVVAKLNAADVLLFTSNRGAEGSPTVIKESLAVGLPVVSVDVGDAPEMLQGVTPGGVVPWPSAESAAARTAWIGGLVERVIEALDAGMRSDGRVMRGFLRAERIAERTLEIYAEAVSSARPARVI